MLPHLALFLYFFVVDAIGWREAFSKGATCPIRINILHDWTCGMGITYTGHARKRMRQRGITPEEVSFVLNHADYVKKSFEGRKEAVGHLKGRSIKIVYAEEESYIKVITVM